MKQKIKNAKTQEGIYGYYTPQSFNPQPDSRIRYDLWQPKNKEYGESIETVLCVDKNDLSPVFLGYAGVKEREKCHCCFAGYAHSEALHQKTMN